MVLFGSITLRLRSHAQQRVSERELGKKFEGPNCGCNNRNKTNITQPVSSCCRTDNRLLHRSKDCRGFTRIGVCGLLAQDRSLPTPKDIEAVGKCPYQRDKQLSSTSTQHSSLDLWQWLAILLLFLSCLQLRRVVRDRTRKFVSTCQPELVQKVYRTWQYLKIGAT